MARWMLLLFFVPTAILASFVLDNEDSSDHWTVYFHADFDKNPLCVVLKCRKHESCLVKDSNALCVKRHKLHEIDGLKVHHETGEVIKDGLQVVDMSEQNQQKQNDVQAKEKKYGQKKNKHNHEHNTRHRKPEADCDEKELLKMGGRLLQWFSDVHAKAEINESPPLPKHGVACRPDIAWMFQQWDGDSDGELSAEELRPLDDDKNEVCLSTFLDRCDQDADDAVSLDEWCDCFAWADDVRHEPPCHSAKRSHDPHLIGSFHPRCDVDGYFKAEQCHERNCWCVDKYGREFDHSRVFGQLPDCGQYGEEIDEDEEFGPDSEL